VDALNTVAVDAEKRARPPRWHAHGWNRAGVYRACAAAAAALPRPARLALASWLAGRFAHRFTAERAAVEASLARIVPEADASGRARLVDQVFRNFARCFADLVSANRRADDASRLLARVDGAEGFEAAARAGRGFVVLTAHVGNWELAGRLLAGRTARPVHVVMAPERDAAVAGFLRRADAPVRFVTLGPPTVAVQLVAALRRGEIVALQGDRALGTRGDAPCAFFGAEARFPLGPFVLARAGGVPVIPVFCLLEADLRYAVTAEEPIVVGEGGESAALGRWVATLERVVRRNPDQWFNFYDVWSPGPAR